MNKHDPLEWLNWETDTKMESRGNNNVILKKGKAKKVKSLKDDSKSHEQLAW